MGKINKKTVDFENGLITLVMDNQTYSEYKESTRKTGFSNAIYQVYKFLKKIEEAKEITPDEIKELENGNFSDETYYFKECVLHLNRLFKDKK